jgi:hypothetical protein
MRKLSVVLMLLVLGLVFNVTAQEVSTDEKIKEVDEKVNGLTERLTTAENDLFKLTKIKVSGYIQAQYNYLDTKSAEATTNNYFMLRRARVKFTYEPLDGVKFVLTPDFVPGNITLKDAYAVLNDRWLHSFSLWAGKFNRPNYEVEYTSSQREVMERSTVIRTLYPNERAIGAKLEYNPLEFPIHVQVALFNGADNMVINNAAGVNQNPVENRDFDSYKDIMARAYYNLSLGSFGGLDFGAHGYFGSLRSMSPYTLNSDYTTLDGVTYGDAVKRNWFGVEAQLFADVLGGLSLKGEYITGQNASIGYMPVAASGSTAAVPGVANFQNNFSGYYIYLIKNIGKKNQFAFRYDMYDPNTDIAGDEIGVKGYTSNNPELKSRTSGKSDIAITTYSLAIHHYFDDNIRVSLGYDIVQNEKVGVNADGVGNVTEDYTQKDGTKVPKGIDYSTAVRNNLLTLRIQAKF